METDSDHLSNDEDRQDGDLQIRSGRTGSSRREEEAGVRVEFRVPGAHSRVDKKKRLTNISQETHDSIFRFRIFKRN